MKKLFSKTNQIPEKVNSWSLVKQLGTRSYPFMVGIYKKSGQKAVLKIWKGKKTSLHYFSMMREVRILKTLSKAQERIKRRVVSFPKFIELKKVEDMTYFASQYIDGEKLIDKSKKLQLASYKSVREFLTAVNKLLTIKEKKTIGVRDLSYFTKTGIILFPLAMVKDIRYIDLYLKAFLQFFRGVFTSFRDNQSLIHGDLSPENMIIKSGKIYLFDFEQSMITFSTYEDATTVSAKKVSKDVRLKISKNVANKKAFSLMLLHVNVYNMVGFLAKKNGHYYRKMIRKAVKK